MNREYSKRSPAVKRLMKEAQELREPTEQYFAQPLEDNLFEWHFTVRGPPDSDFEGGFYHGRIVLPPEYPMKPPSIMLLTATGRFEVGTKICLSISGHHPETWQPSWSIRTVLLAIIGFMPTKGEGAIGSLDYTKEERQVLARKSQEWKCTVCQTPNKMILPKETSPEKSEETQREAREIAAQITFKKEEKKSANPSEGSSQNSSNQRNQPENVGPMAQNPFGMFQNPQFPFQPGMFQFPPNFMPPGQIPPGAAAPPGMNQPGQSQPSTQAPPSSTQAPPSGSSEPSATSSVPSSTQLGTDVRQRSTAATGRQETAPSNPPRTGSASNQRSIPQNVPVTNDLWALILIGILSLVISFLVARRLYITYEYKFDDSPI